MKRIFAALATIAMAFTLSGCLTVGQLESAYTVATTATVPASSVVVAANSFDALKATARNYGSYCVVQKFPRPVCSASNRRAVIKFVRAGTAARNQLEASINTGQPAVATVYNALIAAVQGLQGTPISTVTP